MRQTDGGAVYVHREIFEEFHGPIPDGHHVHHLCGNPTCVNPEHLRSISPSDHIRQHDSPAGINAAKVGCLHGHALSPENTYITRDGRRQCRVCLRRRKREHRQRRREGVAT